MRRACPPPHLLHATATHRYRTEVLQHSTHDEDREAVATVSVVGGNSFHAFLGTAIASIKRELQHQEALEAASRDADNADAEAGRAGKKTGKSGGGGGGGDGGRSSKVRELKRRLDRISNNFRLGQQHLVGLHTYDIHSNPRYRIAFGMEQPLAQHLHRGFYWAERGSMFERVGVQVREGCCVGCGCGYRRQ